MSRWGERSDRETRSIAAKHDALKIQHLRFAERNHPAHATTCLRPAVALTHYRLKFSVSAKRYTQNTTMCGAIAGLTLTINQAQVRAPADFKSGFNWRQREFWRLAAD